MKTALITALACTLTACAAPMSKPPESGVYYVQQGEQDGGKVSSFAKKVQAFRDNGTRVEIRVKSCTSACTYFLLAWDVCTNPDTIYEFHAPQSYGMSLLGLPGPAHGQATIVMAEDYNSRWPGLGTWFIGGNAGKRTGPFVAKVTGQALHDTYGIELCDEQEESE